jgi:hypothetical protein
LWKVRPTLKDGKTASVSSDLAAWKWTSGKQTANLKHTLFILAPMKNLLNASEKDVETVKNAMTVSAIKMDATWLLIDMVITNSTARVPTSKLILKR